MSGKGKPHFLRLIGDELYVRWMANENDCQIASAVGCTPSAVCQWWKKNGLPRNCERGRQWRKEVV